MTFPYFGCQSQIHSRENLQDYYKTYNLHDKPFQWLSQCPVRKMLIIARTHSQILQGHTVRLYKVHQELCSKCQGDCYSRYWGKNLSNLYVPFLVPFLFVLSLSHNCLTEFSLFHAITDWSCSGTTNPSGSLGTL